MIDVYINPLELGGWGDRTQVKIIIKKLIENGYEPRILEVFDTDKQKERYPGISISTKPEPTSEKAVVISYDSPPAGSMYRKIEEVYGKVLYITIHDPGVGFPYPRRKNEIGIISTYFLPEEIERITSIYFLPEEIEPREFWVGYSGSSSQLKVSNKKDFESELKKYLSLPEDVKDRVLISNYACFPDEFDATYALLKFLCEDFEKKSLLLLIDGENLINEYDLEAWGKRFEELGIVLSKESKEEPPNKKCLLYITDRFPQEIFLGLLKYSDLSILTGSMSLFEAIQLGVPFLYRHTNYRSTLIPLCSNLFYHIHTPESTKIGNNLLGFNLIGEYITYPGSNIINSEAEIPQKIKRIIEDSLSNENYRKTFSKVMPEIWSYFPEEIRDSANYILNITREFKETNKSPSEFVYDKKKEYRELIKDIKKYNF